MGILPIYKGIFSNIYYDKQLWYKYISLLVSDFYTSEINLHPLRISTIICSNDAQVFEMLIL